MGSVVVKRGLLCSTRSKVLCILLLAAVRGSKNCPYTLQGLDSGGYFVGTKYVPIISPYRVLRTRTSTMAAPPTGQAARS